MSGVQVLANYTAQVARPAAAYVGTAVVGYAIGNRITKVLEYRTGASYFWVEGKGRLVATPAAGDLLTVEGLAPFGEGPQGPAGPAGPPGVSPLASRSSTSPVTIGLGSKTFGFPSATAIWVVGSRVRAWNSATNWMEGTVTTATATSVVFACDIFSGTGSFSSWTISLTGQPGTAGVAGVGVPAGGTAGQVLAKVDGTPHNTQWVTPSDWTYVFLDEAHTNSTITRTDSSLAFTPVANSRYEVEIRLYVQSAATTTGARPGIRWPTAGLLENAAWLVSPNSAVAASFRFWGGTALADVAATGVALANQSMWSGGWAMFRTGAAPAGGFVITLSSEVAASEARIMGDSFIRYRTI